MSNKNERELTGNVALVTGGSRGIGAAFAKRLAENGASVAITYAKDAGAASGVVKAIELEGGKALARQADSADVEAVRRFLKPDRGRAPRPLPPRSQCRLDIPRG